MEGSVAPLDLASPPIPVNDSEQARKTEATEIAREIVAGVTLPPGAVKVTEPPAPDLTAAPTTEDTQRMATAYALFTMPRGTTSATLADFVDAHLPAGFTHTGEGAARGGPNGDVEYTSYEGAPTGAFEVPQLLVTTEQAGGVTGVRIDAQVVWLPVRSAVETVPTTGVSVTLRDLYPPPSAAGIALGQAESSRLAAILNGLPTASDAKGHCPAVSWQASLTFATTPPTAISIDVCFIGVSVGGVDQPALADDGTLTSAVERLLGLPVDGAGPAASSAAPAASN